ncbi:MAG: hypothetical protein OHK0039_30300 [Bacteroidia bacterium]
MLLQRLFTSLLLTALMVGFAYPVAAQNYGNRHPFDFKRFNLGFMMGLTYNSYNLKEQVDIIEDGILLENIRLIPRYGINFGIVSNMNLAKQVSLRFVPTISLEQRDFRYVFTDHVEMRKIEASYLNLPLMAQFKTDYWNRMRFYVLAGPQVGFNLASNKKVRDDLSLLKITTTDISIALGFGVNLYGDRIKLSPEILYKGGIVNIYEPKYTTHASAISSLFSHVLAFNVNFE